MWSHPRLTCRQGGMLSAASLAALSGVEGRDLLVKNTSDGCFSFPFVSSLPMISGTESDNWLCFSLVACPKMS